MKTTAKWILAGLGLVLASASAKADGNIPSAPVARTFNINYHAIRMWYTQDGDSFKFHAEDVCTGIAPVNRYDVRSFPTGSEYTMDNAIVDCNTTFQGLPAVLEIQVSAELGITNQDWVVPGKRDAATMSVWALIKAPNQSTTVFKNPYSASTVQGTRDVNSDSSIGIIPSTMSVSCTSSSSSGSGSGSGSHSASQVFSGKSFVKTHDQTCTVSEPESFIVLFETTPQ